MQSFIVMIVRIFDLSRCLVIVQVLNGVSRLNVLIMIVLLMCMCSWCRMILNMRLILMFMLMVIRNCQILFQIEMVVLVRIVVKMWYSVNEVVLLMRFFLESMVMMCWGRLRWWLIVVVEIVLGGVMIVFSSSVLGSVSDGMIYYVMNLIVSVVMSISQILRWWICGRLCLNLMKDMLSVVEYSSGGSIRFSSRCLLMLSLGMNGRKEVVSVVIVISSGVGYFFDCVNVVMVIDLMRMQKMFVFMQEV